MIFNASIPGFPRAVAECDKRGCPESYYVPNVSEYPAAERMRRLGWDIATEFISGVISNGISYPSIRGFMAHCPAHITGN